MHDTTQLRQHARRRPIAKTVGTVLGWLAMATTLYVFWLVTP